MSSALSPHLTSPALNGRYLLLSASFPTLDRSPRYFETTDPDELTQSIVAFARAVFVAGGRLVFGGHPSVAPLIMMIAEEYLPASLTERRSINRAKNARVLIYQSKAFESGISAATRTMAEFHLGRICWTNASTLERGKIGRTIDPLAFPRSLRILRRHMLNDRPLSAAIFIGGMEGIEEEAAMYAESYPRGSSYFVGAPGGAAAIIAKERARRAPGKQSSLSQELSASHEYPLLMQRLIEDVSSGTKKRN